MTRRLVLARFRALAFATVLATTSFAVAATPTSTPSGGDPLGRIVDTVTHSEALGQIANALHRAVAPQSAWAYCASNATFTGYLTSSPTSHVALTRTTDLGVFAYISRVDTPFSCTAFYRYSGVAWNTTATAGFFDYGNLIKSTSVSCNFVTGSNDYVKANHSTDCPDTDAEYAMLISLGAERTYVQGSHDAVGRMTFVHSSCSTYYESGTDTGEKVKGGEGAAAEDFTGGNVNNRPGANCASMTIDGLNASPSQTIIYDKTAPSLSFSAPSGSAGTIRGSSSTSFTVSFSATDALAGFGAAHPWTLQRQVAPNIGAGACGTFANDTSTGSVVTGTTNASGQTSAQTVVTGYCYRWILSGTDMNGNPVGSTASATSATLIVDGIAPALSFVAPHAPTITRTGSSISYQVSWVENESGSGIATRSLQRYKVAASTPICAGTFAADGAADANASPLTQTLAAGNCYHWAETLTDLAGRLNTCTSGDVFVSASYPSASFTAPADGTLAYQTGTSLNVTWTEATGGGTIASRSLQRQKASGTMFSCTGLGWTNDGSADTGVSPRNNAGLAEGLYRWTQTATNSGGNTGASASGWLVVDTTAPVGTIETPAANQPVTGNVVITGTAYDTGSFKDYLLEYGVGATPSTWLPIGTFGTPQTAAGSTLATWSPGALSGVYSIRLTVRQNASSATSVTTHTVVLENGGRGDESWLTRVPYDLGGGFTLDVGVANGELRLGRDLGSIPSYGPPQGLSLAYSSSETSATGKLGVGWSSNLTQYLTFETASVTTWHRTDGGREPFGLVGSTWTPPHGHFETMSTAGTEVTITRKDQSRLVFESSGAGRLKRIENRFAKALTIIWSAAGATVSDTSGRGPAAGQTYNLLYDSGNARITSYIDYAGRTWSFGYTGTGASSDLTCITDPVLKVTRLSYASHALTGIVRGGATCASGGTATWTVGYTSGRVTSVKSPTVTHPDVFATPPDGSVTWSQVVDDTTPDYATTGWAFDTSGTGRVRIATDPEGGSVSHDYDLDSNVLARSAPTETGLASTTSEYDARGNQTKETKVLDVGTDPVDPSDDTTLVTVWTYNAGNDVVSRTDGDNDAGVRTVTKYTYDVAGHLVSEDRNCTTSGTTIPGQGAGGACTGAGTQNADTNVITNYAYSINDQLAFEQDPMGRVTKHIYDSYGNETSTIANCTTSGTTPPSPFDTCTGAGTADATTNVVTSSAFLATDVDGKAGLPTSSTDALVRTTTYDYDALGRLKSEALPGDASIPALTRTMTFDEYGNTLTETEAWTDPRDSTAQTRVTTHTYDAESQETVVVDPTNQTETATTYDPAGNVDATTVRSVDGLIVVSVTTDGYDRASRQTEEAVVGADATATTKRKYTTLSAVALTTLPDGTQQRATVRFDGAATATELLPADADANDPGATVLSTDGATFDILGRETATDDGDADTANDTTTTYDRLGRVLTTGPTGALSTFTYDRAGNQLTSTDAAGIATTTTYDPLNRAVVVIANDVATPLGPTDDVTTTTWYDAAGNLIAARDPRGITTRTVVNARDMTSETIADCTDTGTLTPSTNPPACTGGTPTLTANVKTDLSYDGQGNVTKTVSAVGLGSPYQATMETAYDAAGRVQATLDPRGTITRNIYNTAGQLTDSYLNCTTSGTTVPTTFPAWAQCTGGGANDGTYNVRTRYAYDDLGNVITVTAPNGRKTVTELDADNRVSATVENWVDGVFSSASPTEDVRTTYAYDDAGRRAAVVAPTADGTGTVVTRTIYNPDGTVASEIRNCTDSPVGAPEACTGTAGPSAAANLTTSYVYDARGNVIKQASPDPSATSGGSSATITTASAFEADNRLCRVVENATAGTDLQALAHPCSDATQDAGTLTTNLSTRYGYDGIGNLTSMVDAAGNTTTYGYDAAGHPTGRTDAQSGALAWTYDDIGNRTAQRNRIDPVLTTSVAWTYDPFGRMLSRTADSATTSGTYDMSGNKLTATSAIGTITATYDRLNRVLTVDDEDAGSTADTTYTYALSSSSWSDPSGSYTASLDAYNRATSLTDPADGATPFSWSYGSGGQVLSATAPNGNITTRTYDGVSRELDRETKTGSTSRAHYTWAYNGAGQVLSEASTVAGDPANGTLTYAYDPLGQLTGSTLSGTATAYGWDKATNRTSVQMGAGTAATTAYDAANRPTSGANPTSSYASDADGELIARPGQTFVWDHLGRLTAVKDAAGTTTLAAYTYDPLDRLRTAADGAGGRVRFRYTGLTTAVAQWWDDVAGTVSRNVGNGWTGERLLDWLPGATPDRRYYGENAHHDVTWLADNSGAVSKQLRYDSWGNPRSAVPSGYTPFRFQGSWYDANSDLSWVVTRWYAPTLGRFVSEDTLLGDPARPDSRNLYAYAAGDPVGAWDQDGHLWYRVRPGDTLWGLAARFLGSGQQWKHIYRINSTRIRSPELMRAGQCIAIPVKGRSTCRHGLQPPSTDAPQPGPHPNNDCEQDPEQSFCKEQSQEWQFLDPFTVVRTAGFCQGLGAGFVAGFGAGDLCFVEDSARRKAITWTVGAGLQLGLLADANVAVQISNSGNVKDQYGLFWNFGGDIGLYGVVSADFSWGDGGVRTVTMAVGGGFAAAVRFGPSWTFVYDDQRDIQQAIGMIGFDPWFLVNQIWNTRQSYLRRMHQAFG